MHACIYKAFVTCPQTITSLHWEIAPHLWPKVPIFAPLLKSFEQIHVYAFFYAAPQVWRRLPETSPGSTLLFFQFVLRTLQFLRLVTCQGHLFYHTAWNCLCILVLPYTSVFICCLLSSLALWALWDRDSFFILSLSWTRGHANIKNALWEVARSFG